MTMKIVNEDQGIYLLIIDENVDFHMPLNCLNNFKKSSYRSVKSFFFHKFRFIFRLIKLTARQEQQKFMITVKKSKNSGYPTLS